MKRIIILFFAVMSYLFGLGAIVYYAGFLSEIGVPKSINGGARSSTGIAITVNLLLLATFGIQHSVMARKGFKKWLKRWVPSSAERSVYIFMSSAVTLLICRYWIPLPYEIYDLRESVWENFFWGLYGLGWFFGLFSTFLIDHFDLFGLKQAWYQWKGKTEFRYQFKTPLLYRIVRHPIYLGWLMIHWFTPHLTAGHILYASVITLYIYIAVYFEERDLVNEFGNTYREYQESTPKLIPVLGQTKKKG